MTQQVGQRQEPTQNELDTRLETSVRQRLPKPIADFVMFQNRRPSAGLKANLPVYVIIMLMVIALLFTVF